MSVDVTQDFIDEVKGCLNRGGGGGYTLAEAIDIGLAIVVSPYSGEYLVNLIPSFADATAAASASITVDGVTYTASASSAWTYGATNNYAYRVFDRDYTTTITNNVGWQPNSGALAADTWLQIEADQVLPIPDVVLVTYTSTLTGDATCVIQSSRDGETWTDVSDIVTLSPTGSRSIMTTVAIPLQNVSGSDLKYRLQFLSSVDTAISVVDGPFIGITELGLMRYKEE